MSDIRAPDIKEQAKEDYLNGMKYKDLAEKYSVSLNTIKSWIKRYNWSKEKKEKGAHKNKKGAPYNNKNAEGHGAPKGNKNAETHGFFSKYLPEETFDIIQEINKKNPLDILWENISIQYAAIIRSQRIMDVKNQEDLTKVLKRQKESTGDTSESWEKEYELQFAWDKQSTFLQAQSRAMKTLESMIKQYDELLKSNLATEEQKLRIEKLKVDISNANGGNNDSNKEGIKEFVKATTMNKAEVKEIFKDDENEKEETE
ncbi:phage terminase small subunit [Clostridium scatologenes]|uniref:Phage protein n=1 Tax=Clostridium scatologenes TaxID=1548 RepID=A0A0E3JMU8_CLOSL|nr:phage terminase small subunit [Clostridium scatologenes]AKA68535.1 phage protein [Clostridium scatologenes]